VTELTLIVATTATIEAAVTVEAMQEGLIPAEDSAEAVEDAVVEVEAVVVGITTADTQNVEPANQHQEKKDSLGRDHRRTSSPYQQLR